MNGPFKDIWWTDSFKRTDRSAIEQRWTGLLWTDPLWTDLGWTDQNATWHSTNNRVLSKKSYMEIT